MADIPAFSPDMMPDDIRHIPMPKDWDERDRSWVIPNWDDPEVGALFPDEASRMQVSMLIDPCKWAEQEIKVIHPETKKVVPYEARWYQEDLLQDYRRYQIWRLGRQTGKTTSIMIKALHHAFTHENSKVLILTPYDEQVKKIFWDRPGINFMIENSSTLGASVVGRLTKSPPYRVKLNNGSVIVGMTAGTKSGAGGGAARGKDSDFIILDEADYLDDNDLRTIMGVRIGNPNVRIIASSTPSGKRGMWYDWNFNGRWALHHYPSSVVPHWDNIMDYDKDGNPITFGQEILAGFDDYGIITEVLAQFPEELMGVFPKYYLDIMFGDPSVLGEIGRHNYSDYTYPMRPTFKTNKRVMGVDVDKYATGPEIVIVEYNDVIQKAFVLHRETIPRGKRGALTLHSLCDKIIEMDKQFRCSFIYVDRGYGEMVVETLHKYGKETNNQHFVNKVQGVFYGDHIEVPDPARRGMMTKLPCKPYLIQLVVRWIEKMAIVASRHDLKLKRQMEGFQVVARSATTGMPRFTMKNEHALDALTFAMYGLVVNFFDELIFPRGATGTVVRRQNMMSHRQDTYIDMYTDQVVPRVDVSMRPDVLQVHDLPPGMRKSIVRPGRGLGRAAGLGRAPDRTIWTPGRGGSSSRRYY